jgi:carbon-monoxide dehydrogenase large subunit
MYPRGCVTEGVQVATIMPGPYRVPAYASSLRVVFTNKTPLAVYRAVGTRRPSW